jgi:hypothetical protein
MSEHLRLAAVNGEAMVPVGPLADDLMAASFIALGESILAGKIKIEQAIVVAVIDGGVTYTPIGHVSIVEGIGLLELASRKIERDAISG